ncbi:hypothetical protein STEG23_017272, partial [Scotinomys teguina]
PVIRGVLEEAPPVKPMGVREKETRRIKKDRVSLSRVQSLTSTPENIGSNEDDWAVGQWLTYQIFTDQSSTKNQQLRQYGDALWVAWL